MDHLWMDDEDSFESEVFQEFDRETEWMGADGEIHLISEMTDSHLANAFRYLAGCGRGEGAAVSINALRDEIAHRSELALSNRRGWLA